jgi:hypothetical protein
MLAMAKAMTKSEAPTPWQIAIRDAGIIFGVTFLSLLMAAVITNSPQQWSDIASLRCIGYPLLSGGLAFFMSLAVSFKVKLPKS